MEESKKRFSIFEFIGKLVLKTIMVFVMFAVFLSAICTLLAKVFGKKVCIRINFDDIDENTVEAKAEEKDSSDEATESDAE